MDTRQPEGRLTLPLGGLPTGPPTAPEVLAAGNTVVEAAASSCAGQSSAAAVAAAGQRDRRQKNMQEMRRSYARK